MLNLSDDHEIFRGYTTIIELYNALKFITMLFFIQNILTFDLGVAFLNDARLLVENPFVEHDYSSNTTAGRKKRSSPTLGRFYF